jgi:hypothetical protein
MIAKHTPMCNVTDDGKPRAPWVVLVRPGRFPAFTKGGQWRTIPNHKI